VKIGAGKVIEFLWLSVNLHLRFLEALRYAGCKEHLRINLCIMVRGTPREVLLSSCTSRDGDHKWISGNAKMEHMSGSVFGLHSYKYFEARYI